MVLEFFGEAALQRVHLKDFLDADAKELTIEIAGYCDLRHVFSPSVFKR